MKEKISIVLALSFLFCITTIFAQTNVEIAQEIDEMNRISKEFRSKSQKLADLEGENSQAYQNSLADISEMDHMNFNRVKNIVADKGIPTISMVGAESSHNFVELVTRFHGVPNFQMKILRQMDRALDQNEITQEDYNLLTDKVRANRGLRPLNGASLRTEGENRVVENKETVKMGEKKTPTTNKPNKNSVRY